MAVLYALEQLYGWINKRNTTGMQRLEYLKTIHAEVSKKKELAEKVAVKLGKSTAYVMQEYLQKGWRIPEEDLERIISITEKHLRKEIKKKQKPLETI